LVGTGLDIDVLWKIVSTKVDTYQQPPLPVDPRHAWMNSFDI